MNRIYLFISCLAVAGIGAGCATSLDRTMPLLSGDGSYRPMTALTSEAWLGELDAISAVGSNMATTCDRLSEWKSKRRGRKGFTSHDTEEIASHQHS